MLNIGTGELIVIAVVALLVLGPKRLPELARGIGKFMREFRRQTDEVRGVVEREFYKMDNEINTQPPVVPQPAPGVVAVDAPKPSAPAPEAQQLALPMQEPPAPSPSVPAVPAAPSVAEAPEKKAS
jgi:sec-independent protein translocase protein TatB